MYRKFRNVPLFKDIPPICPYFLGFRVGKYASVLDVRVEIYHTCKNSFDALILLNIVEAWLFYFKFDVHVCNNDIQIDQFWYKSCKTYAVAINDWISRLKIT